jgi:hypothetical protein
MRQGTEQNNKADGPLGIRTAVWFTVCGLLLVCVVTIGLLRYRTDAPTGDVTRANVVDQDLSPRRTARIIRRSVHENLAPQLYAGTTDRDDEEPRVSMIELMVHDRPTWIDAPAGGQRRYATRP